MISLIVAGRRPEIIQRVDDNAFLARGHKIHGHSGADKIALLGDDRVDVRIHGIHPRWNEYTRCKRTLLVDIVDDLRMPHVLELRNGVARFGLGKNVPIAIVIVADVLVI